MRTAIILLIGMLAGNAAIAQQGKVDLSKDPARPAKALTKSNAQLLKETTPTSTNNAPGNLDDNYKPDAATNGTANTRSYVPATNTYGTTEVQPQMMNSTNNQYNLGNGVKANSATYYDDAGKVRSSGTSIQFGNKKK